MGADRRAFELAGMFDAGVPYGFDEDMWERRLRERGGHVMYVARPGSCTGATRATRACAP